MAGREATGIKTLKLKDFSGGLNGNTYTMEVEANTAADCQNVYWSGILRTIFGQTRINHPIPSEGSTKDINGIYQFITRAGNKYLIILTEDDCFYDNSGVWTDLNTGGGALTLTNALYSFVTFNDYMIATNGDTINGPIALTNNIATPLSALSGVAGYTGTAYPARYVTSYNDYIILLGLYAGGVWQTNQFQVSAQDDPLNWPSDRIFDVDINDGDSIVAAAQLGKDLVVFRTNSICKISGQDHPKYWTKDNAYIRGIGCTAPHSLDHAFIPIEGAYKEVLIFIYKDGLYAFDGTYTYKLPILKEAKQYKAASFFDNLSQQYISNAVGRFSQPLNTYIAFTTPSGIATNISGFFYNTITDSFWPLADFSCKCISSMRDTTTDALSILTGSYAGLVNQFSLTEHEIESTTELISNGDCETGGGAGTLPTGYTAYGTPSTAGKSPARYKTTANSIIITVDAVAEGFYQDITTVVGSRYRVWAYILGDGTHDCVLEKQDTDGTDVVDSPRVLAASWTRVTLEFWATETTSRIVIRDWDSTINTFYADSISARNCDIDAYWESQWLDLDTPEMLKLLREFGLEAVTTSTANEMSISIYINNEAGVEDTGTFSIADVGSAYGTGLYGTAVYGGGAQILGDISNLINTAFRKIKFRFSQTVGGKPIYIKQAILAIKPIGDRYLDEN